jgi:hypothetical protein
MSSKLDFTPEAATHDELVMRMRRLTRAERAALIRRCKRRLLTSQADERRRPAVDYLVALYPDSLPTIEWALSWRSRDIRAYRTHFLLFARSHLPTDFQVALRSESSL